MFGIEDFFAGLKNAARVNVEICDELCVFTKEYKDFDGDTIEQKAIGQVIKGEIDEIVQELNDNYTFHDVFLYNNNYYEVAVNPIDRASGMLSRYDQGNYNLTEHGYSFEISKTSPKYFVALFCGITENNADSVMSNLARPFFREQVSNLESFIELFRLNTIHISCTFKNSLSEYKRLSYSYLFNIAYNYNMAYSICDFSQRRRISLRRIQKKGQLFPYRIYRSELTAYYYQALASDIPFTQYLAFYHVAETFFQSLSEQSAIDEIRNFVTRPSFSPNKREELKQLYEKLKKKTREQREDGVWNEKTALLICLKYYIPDLSVLRLAINRTDSNAIAYYNSSLVDFADDSKLVDFDSNPEVVYNSIRDRVYSVRNAIVHSKVGDRTRYEPFQHDGILIREIPLIKCIAEEIIIGSATYNEIKVDN